jgi:D-arabinose 1-dehydrogenase-like Zn-dependent alcohol dehydrogenase
VSGFPEGQRVGVGWYGGHCGVCAPCRHGNLIQCRNLKICGISFDGGYADYLVAPAMALARIPDDLNAQEAGPLLCAGITTFNALRHSGAKGGDLVAVHGIGGLGHLGVQFANRLGYRVVAVARGDDKRDLAMSLGAHRYINTDREDPARELAAMGGASVILTTVTSGKAMSSLLGGLAVDGTFMVVGATADPIEVPTILLIMTGASVKGWAAGTSIDSEETMAFSTLTKVRPMIETFPLEQAPEAYDRMMSNKARFRVVLTMT